MELNQSQSQNNKNCVNNIEAVASNNDSLLKLYEELQVIYEQSNDSILVTDGNGNIIKINSATEKFFSMPRASIIGKNVKWMEEKGIYKPSVVSKVLQSGKEITLVQEIKNGKKVICTGTPVFNEKHQIERVICNTRDYTELLDLKDRLEAAEKLKEYYQIQLSNLYNLNNPEGNLYYKNESMVEIYNLIRRIAKTDPSILITGESGVGKNILASEIHKTSVRNKGPFIEINCGAIPENLLESELFGYKKGAFTGAEVDGKAGLIEIANNGTLFLNEISEMPIALQTKLLQVIQDKKLRRLGSLTEIDLNIRIISATNKNLKELVKQNLFREDLYYRLNVIPIHIPSLRERKEEILGLLNMYVSTFNKKYNLKKELHPKTILYLINYDWPGNVRELVNVVERIVVTSEKDMITYDLLPEEILGFSDDSDLSMKEALETAEKRVLLNAMLKTSNTYELAKLIGLSQPSVVRRLQKYRLSYSQNRHGKSKPTDK